MVLLFNFARSEEATSCSRALPQDFCRQGESGRGGATHTLEHPQAPLGAPQGRHQVLLVVFLTQVLHALLHWSDTSTQASAARDFPISLELRQGQPLRLRSLQESRCTHASLAFLPLSTMWSKPPSSRSSSLNQSPALLEVRERSVSMARCPVCSTQNQKSQFTIQHWAVQ